MFTPEAIHTLLSSGGVLKGRNGPAPGDPALSRLASVLNGYKQVVKFWQSGWREEWSQIGAAISVLTEILPKAHADYRRTHELQLNREMGKSPDGGWLQEQENDLAALGALIAAAKVVRDRGLPPAPLDSLSVPVESWHYIARPLFETFKRALPTASTEAGYRFIEAVVPSLTDERPTYEAVRSELMRKRDVNRGK